jgi:hypothetical protein
MEEKLILSLIIQNPVIPIANKNSPSLEIIFLCYNWNQH